MFTFPVSFFSTVAVISNTVNLTYVSNGDINGLIYYLGTNKLTTTFSNPHTFYCINSAIGIGSGSVDAITDRANTVFNTTDTANSWISTSIGGNSISINRYNIRTINGGTGTIYLRNWKLQGSTDNTNWVDLDTKTNNTTLNAPSTWYTFTVTPGNSYPIIRILNTGLNSSSNNIISIDEWEFYGTLTPNSIPTSTVTFDTLGGNDIFYYLGTYGNTTNWLNPNTLCRIITTASSINFGTLNSITDRANSDFLCNPGLDNWVKFNFVNYKVKPNYYVIRARSGSNALHLRNWKLQGSNDDNNWIDLDTRVNDTSLNNVNVLAGFSCTSSISYKFIRILLTGVDSSGASYLTLGDFYIYGDLTT